MTSDILQLAFGVWLLTTLVSYVVWTKTRVVLYRQHVYLIRSQLWDRARDLEELSDPAYLEMRSHLNSCIHAATWLSLPSLLLAVESQQVRRRRVLRAKDDRLQVAIDDARLQSLRALYRYVVWWRPFSAIGTFVSLGTIKAVKELIEKWFQTTSAEQLSRTDQELRHMQT